MYHNMLDGQRKYNVTWYSNSCFLEARPSCLEAQRGERGITKMLFACRRLGAVVDLIGWCVSSTPKSHWIDCNGRGPEPVSAYFWMILVAVSWCLWVSCHADWMGGVLAIGRNADCHIVCVALNRLTQQNAHSSTCEACMYVSMCVCKYVSM